VAAIDFLKSHGIIILQRRGETEAMALHTIIWDLDDDPEGNVQRCAEHDVTKEEVEEVLQQPSDVDVSRSSGRPVVFGDTSAGRPLMVVYETIEADVVYPITAYEVPRR
jgi:hypothetical protein